MPKILIVDDDQIIAIKLKQVCRKMKIDYLYAENGKQAFSHIENNQIDLILLDFQLPDMTGFDILRFINKNYPHIQVIMITSFGEVRKAVSAMKLGAYDFFTKPFDSEEIMQVITKALNNDTSFLSLPDVMGASTTLQKALELVKRVAKTDISVFLEGETGTGKELFSRLLHQNSNRKTQPFIPVDCGAIPETLLESELFGHKKGAFTGALQNKKGKFELADKGTLFLDEINNLPLSMQPKLLRVLQEKEIQRLGDENPIKIDVRIVSASNKNIIEDVKNGKFREDLFYRLHEFKISLPTLSERFEDIPIISEDIIEKTCDSLHVERKFLTEEAQTKLQNYSWPGNIRELQNVIKSAVLLSDDSRIEADHIVFHSFLSSDSTDSDDLLLEKYTQKAEKQAIQKTLHKTNNNKQESAKLLGISRSQLYKKMEKLKIQ